MDDDGKWAPDNNGAGSWAWAFPLPPSHYPLSVEAREFLGRKNSLNLVQTPTWGAAISKIVLCKKPTETMGT